MKRAPIVVASRDAGADAASLGRRVEVAVGVPKPVDRSAADVVTGQGVRRRRGLLFLLGRVNNVTTSSLALVRLRLGRLVNRREDRCSVVSCARDVHLDGVNGALDPGQVEEGRAIKRSTDEAAEDDARVPDDRATTSEEMVNVICAFPAERAAGVGLQASLKIVREVNGLPSSLGGPGVNGEQELIPAEAVRDLRWEGRKMAMDSINRELVEGEAPTLKMFGCVVVLVLKVGDAGESIVH